MKKTKNINLSFNQKTIIFQQLQSYIGPNTRLVIALSGGPDSVFVAWVLQDFFVTLGYSLKNLFVVHCNHATRKENTKEEQFVKDIFSHLQVDSVKRLS